MNADALRAAFHHPDDEFSPMPFWFWNDVLTEDEITRQIRDFHAHGVAGFVIHPRKGLPASIPYLSDDYMHFVRHAVAEAARLGMRVVLYDEGMYPSGAAHGMVAAENPAWASRCLWMEQHDADVADAPDVVAACVVPSVRECGSARAVQAENGVYRAEKGRKLLIFRQGFSGGTIRGVHENEDDGEPLAPRSADLLNPDAVACFIRLTHERYYAALPEYFGSTVIAMFTDEPDVVGRNARPGALAWTEGFLAEFGPAEMLPLLFLEGEDAPRVRRQYRQAVNRRMVRTYYQPLADWCAAHGVALTGHPAKGWDIGLLAPFQLPGQDVVWRYVEPGRGIRGDESVLGKCASDAARHAERRRNANECFGCCGPAPSQWGMTASDMKWYMDYLFVRGCNLLYPHAFYYSIRDGRGDERPPDAGPNNAWWPEYGRIAAYMRRMCLINTDSVNQARTAVLCEGDRMPWECCIPLYEQQREFNYLEVGLLPRCRVDNGALLLADQRYTHVLAEGVPLDAEAAAVLAEFRRQGGTVLTREGAQRCPQELQTDPAMPDLRVTHVVRNGLHLYLLVNEGEDTLEGTVTLNVQGRVERWDAWTGDVTPAAPWQGRYALRLDSRESVVLAVDPTREPLREEMTAPREQVVLLRPDAWTLTRADGMQAVITPGADGRFPGWETLPGWENHSGTVTYEAEVMEAQDGCLADFGEVHEIVTAYANGEKLGTRLWGRCIFRLPAGRVKLRLEVTNTPAGRMDGVALPSGVIG